MHVDHAHFRGVTPPLVTTVSMACTRTARAAFEGKYRHQMSERGALTPAVLKLYALRLSFKLLRWQQPLNTQTSLTICTNESPGIQKVVLVFSAPLLLHLTNGIKTRTELLWRAWRNEPSHKIPRLLNIPLPETSSTT